MALESFLPIVQRWFAAELGAPTLPQQRAWPAILRGEHVLVAAPTGSGKTLAAFLCALDGLLRQGAALAERTSVLYVSPLRALVNDVQKNLAAPLARLRELDPTLPDVRVLVRTGDTPRKERAAMSARPPHILVTTPESLYILLTSESGRAMLRDVRTAIIDEVHAVVGDKRGSHLALSLERLCALAGEVQRVGLSATQKPIEDVARYLTGTLRECTLIDEGHLRELDVRVEIPPSPLETVCSAETWGEIYRRVAELALEHRTTLVFVGTRKLAERSSAELAKLLGDDKVGCHHSSLSRERRLAAEERLKRGELRVLVATASLELGIDIGEVELTVQLGTTRSIAAFLQRVGRSGHGVGRTPKGVLFPMTRDELEESAALLRAVRTGKLDRTPQPRAPLDILAQQVVAECASGAWNEGELHARMGRAWPYRDTPREDFDALLELHSSGRAALLHRDRVHGSVRGTRRARLIAITCGGAIPDIGHYKVYVEPDGTFIGTVDEDFGIDSVIGDVFQLGNRSWRVLRIERGALRVGDAFGTPPSLPFWFGEASSRTRELCEEICELRELTPSERERQTLLPTAAAHTLAEYLDDCRRTLGTLPTTRRMVLERFFDESGGMQLVLHSPFGGRINRALGLALRKRFCRHFGFELQAAATEDAVLLSLGPMHSFPLEEVFDYLHPRTARDVLAQAVLASPLFEARWRWNVQRALLVARFHAGARVSAPLLRMRSDDLLAAAFPEVLACGENLPPGDLAIPEEHVLVRQTIHDCLHEAMDVEGMLEVLRGLRDGSIERVAVDVSAPSELARNVLCARPYAFLDDAPLEERRTHAVANRRALRERDAADIGALDPLAIARVREEAWPDPRHAEEVHEALSWMGWVEEREATEWKPWLAELAAAGRVVREGERWLAVDSTRDPEAMLRGRLEALGPVHGDDPLFVQLESKGFVLRTIVDGRAAWCERRLLARIRGYTLDALRREVQPVSTSVFLRFLRAWQHVADPLDGRGGLEAVLSQLAGFEATPTEWEETILPARVKDYRPEWLDQLGLSGRIAWGRLWGAGRSSPRATPIAFYPREDGDLWLGFERSGEPPELTWPARAVLEALRSRGASFADDLPRACGLLGVDVDRGLAELVGCGLASSDGFGALRHLMRQSGQRHFRALSPGRWSLLEREGRPREESEALAKALLRRYGVLFRALLERERFPTPWRDLVRALRALELRGDVRGGRFVERFSGEQYALPEAVVALRKQRREPACESEPCASCDPLHLPQLLAPPSAPRATSASS
ncbi:MAG: DEAD/DEAH box helicase [Planctomycetes bacterium]|nr:DEAD/DEAH box helicase [Planctomycetota bacterium]